MNENQNPLSGLCDYLCDWTLSQYEREEYQTEEGCTISLEVRDRCISVIGIVVPVGLYVLALFLTVFMIVCIGSGVRGRGRK